MEREQGSASPHQQHSTDEVELWGSCHISSTLDDDALSCIIQHSNLKLLFRLSLVRRKMNDTFVWQNITTINFDDFTGPQCWRTFVEKRTVLRKVDRVICNSLLDPSLESFFPGELDPEEWRQQVEEDEERMGQIALILSAIGPQLRFVNLTGKHVETRVTEQFFACCNTGKLVSLRLTSRTPRLLSLAESGLHNLQCIWLSVFQSDISAFCEVLDVMRTKSGSLRYLSLYIGNEIVEPETRLINSALRGLLAANPSVCFDFSFGRRMWVLACLGAKSASEWRLLPSYSMQHLGVAISRCRVSGFTFWHECYTGELAAQFLAQGPDAAQFLWDACHGEKKDNDTKSMTYELSRALFHITSPLFQSEDSEKFCMWAVSLLRTFTDFNHPETIRSIFLACGNLLLSDSFTNREPVVDLVRYITLRDERPPLSMLTDVEQQACHPDAPLRAISASFDRIELQRLDFVTAEQELQFAKKLIAHTKRFKFILKKVIGEDTIRSTPSGRTFHELMLFGLFQFGSRDRDEICKCLLPRMIEMKWGLSLTGLRQLYDFQTVLETPSVFEKLCVMIEDFEPLIPLMRLVRGTPLSLFRRLFEAIHLRRTGSSVLPDDTRRRMTEFWWDSLYSSAFRDEARIRKEIVDALELWPAIPATELAFYNSPGENFIVASEKFKIKREIDKFKHIWKRDQEEKMSLSSV
eukprot:TRINITY_DN3407_c0_g1_i1.p1 TRINITY_DN3407_c0_g1~~TRINITY_DN3407_c0_g1_i1.p1  ORF type:complete len:741 (+),score=65.99 TRINITY_DN3407_c0_g1_i1:143-2224(+)